MRQQTAQSARTKIRQRQAAARHAHHELQDPEPGDTGKLLAKALIWRAMQSTCYLIGLCVTLTMAFLMMGNLVCLVTGGAVMYSLWTWTAAHALHIIAGVMLFAVFDEFVAKRVWHRTWRAGCEALEAIDSDPLLTDDERTIQRRTLHWVMDECLDPDQPQWPQTGARSWRSVHVQQPLAAAGA